MFSGLSKLYQKLDEWDKTIVVVPSYPLKNLALPARENETDPQDETIEQQFFKIRLAHSTERVNSASMLVQRKYAGRGYLVNDFQKTPERITLMAFQDDKVIGTLTLGMDSPNGLQVEDLYQAEIRALRQAGRKIGELTQLAVAQTQASKLVLASLFHIAYIYGHVLLEYTDVVIEVNPRHVGFYKRMLGFVELGSERMCGRVNAPAVLLRLGLDYVDKQIELLGGKHEGAQGERSLYPYFLTKRDEIGITQRLICGCT